MSKKKPIRVFYSELSERFYASDGYREEPNGVFVITGDKYDVTNDIGSLINRYNVEFVPTEEEACPVEDQT